MRNFNLLFLLLAVVFAGSCVAVPEGNGGSSSVTVSPATVTVYTFRVVTAYPHNSGAFTEGLAFAGGFLYEGTGRYGESSLRRVDLETGRVLQIYELPERYFGEGITLSSDTIVQLTWKSGTGFVYDRESFEPLGDFNYETEGWGITSEGERLIISDGTSTLFFLDPETFKVVDSIDVFDGDMPVDNLNELEYIDGRIYANVWQTDCIAIINPRDGRVEGWIDLAGLLSEPESDTADVLNGIAYDAVNDRLFVTGKLWPRLFEIDLVES